MALNEAAQVADKTHDERILLRSDQVGAPH